jgi:two-component system chemotaxis response regulator CheB
MLGDGSLGLREVRHHGGLAVVQDPADALFGDMPGKAVEIAEPDHVVPAREMPALLRRLVATPMSPIPPVEAIEMTDEDAGTEDWRPDAPPGSADAPGTPTGYSCPDCHGVLWELPGTDGEGFRCRTGHRLSLESLVEMKDREVEDALYGAARALEEQASTRRRLVERLRARGAGETLRTFDDKVDSAVRQAAVLRQLIEELTTARAGG